MADGPSTSHDDFLAQEVQQSGTDEAIKAETLATLARAEEIKALF